jgi:prepilin-type processing-associated H-X9-DG protein/prepilin-type N-terminal cleavage/methylation domain-containing protein
MRRIRGFTLVELLVVIGVIALLIAMLMPALNKARAQANTVACLSNLRQLGICMIMYANDYKQAVLPIQPWDPPAPRTFTGDRTWLGLLYELRYFRGSGVTRCPGDWIVTAGGIHGAYSFGPSTENADGKSGYAMNNFGFGSSYGPTWPGFRRNDVKFPDETFWMYDNLDAPGYSGAATYWYPPSYGPLKRHSGGINALWCDGHATWITEETAWWHSYYGMYFGPPGNQRWDDVP